MFKNFIVEKIHATRMVKAKNLTVENTANIKTLDVEKIVDNGEVYGETSDISELVSEPILEPGETPGPGKNCNWSGDTEKPARANHQHKIPESIKNPQKLIIKDNAGNDVTDYDGAVQKELRITPSVAGAAKENHASPNTTYGLGDTTNYGHVKLSDSINNDSGITSGVAATPKAIKTISGNYLPLKGDKRMTGTLVTLPHVVDEETGKNIPSIQVGGAALLTDLGEPNVLELAGFSNRSIGALSFGDDKSTILLSKQTGHLYLKNSSEAQKSLGFTVDGERMLVDYQIEQIFDKNGTKYWIPQRTGWYRIYVVGGGGNGAAGFVEAAGIRRGELARNNQSTPYNGTENGHYEGTYMGSGYAVPGCGGGGGGVAVVDIYVSKEAYAYQISTAKVTQAVYDDDGNKIGDVVEEYSVETPVQKKAVVKINTSNKTAQISNLFAVYGGSVSIGDIVSSEDNSEGDSNVDDLDAPVANSDVAPIIGYPGLNAVAGKRFNVAKDNSYGYRNIVPEDVPGITNDQKNMLNVANAWLTDKNGNIYGKFKGYELNYDSTDSKYNYKKGDYFVEEGTRFDWFSNLDKGSSVVASPDKTWRLFDGVTHMEKGNYLDADVKKIIDKSGYKHGTTSWGTTTGVGKEFVIGKKIRLVTGQGSTKKRYNYYGIKFSVPGIGGRAVGGDVNHRGGNGDVTLVKAPSNKTTIPGYDSHGDLTPEGYPFRADGYCGGVPGLNLATGCVGGNASGGYVKNIAAYNYRRVNGSGTSCKWQFQSAGVIGARSGYGASLNITELGNYSGPSIATPTKNKAGKGYLGGGGGGGHAMFAMGISTVTTETTDANGNPIVTTTKTFGIKKSVLSGNNGGGPCVVIAYLGDSDPKEQNTTDSVVGSFKDDNNDGIDDAAQIAITYVARDSSVATIVNTSAVVTLVDSEETPTEFGAADIKNTRPVTTSAFGYKGNPIYVPSDEIIDSNFGSGGKATIEVYYERDDSKWYDVEFVAGTGGTLSGTTVYNDQLYGTSMVAPKAEPDSGYRFVGWEPSLPQTIIADGQYTAVFEKLCTVKFLPGNYGTLSGTTEYKDIVPGSAFTGTSPTVTPDTGYEFNGWAPNVPETVTSDVTCVAQYTQTFVTLTFLPGEHGTFDNLIPSHQIVVRAGSDISERIAELTGYVNPYDGYTFVGWSSTGNNNSSDLLINDAPESDTTYTAVYI